ncbi:MAG TPA: nucleoside-triphosphatase [Anaerolineaceae bacterium]|nr:nucleoside-triphosphatase [Anaerolineaceae bacterium]
MSTPQPGDILLISGPRGAGKTCLCARFAARLQAVGWDLAGIISPGVYGERGRVAIQTLDLRSNQRRTLASLRAGQSSAIQTAGWSFDANSLSWGNRVLEQATPCDVLVIDELGPLEFIRGQGWTAGIAALDRGSYRFALAVIRPELIALAGKRWPRAQVAEIRSCAEGQELARSLHRTWGYTTVR